MLEEDDLIIDDSEEEDEEKEQESLDTDTKDTVALSFHHLPLNLITDLVHAYSGKHVLDFTPNPMNLAAECAIKGISYFGVCCSDVLYILICDL